MEVHHHRHADSHSNLGKRFKEYFLEFLMIFLAVTLGFFAESLRENISNHKREVSYMRSIVNDLNADTSEIRQLKPGQNFLLEQFNAALNIPPQQLRDPALQDSFYHHYMYFYSFVSYFEAHNKAMAQLRNAGGLAIISRQDVIDSISELDLFYDYYISDDNNLLNDLYKKTNEEGAKVISCPAFMTSMKLPVPAISHNLPIFITEDISTIRELYNYINMEEGQLEQCIVSQENYQRRAERLISFISEKYHFDEEARH
jgi:hypothetical protein